MATTDPRLSDTKTRPIAVWVLDTDTLDGFVDPAAIV